MVQAMGLDVSAGVRARRNYFSRDTRLLRFRFSGYRSQIPFRQRHALWHISLFHVRFPAMGLDWREDQQLTNLKPGRQTL
jgi:hypothetical protein